MAVLLDELYLASLLADLTRLLVASALMVWVLTRTFRWLRFDARAALDLIEADAKAAAGVLAAALVAAGLVLSAFVG